MVKVGDLLDVIAPHDRDRRSQLRERLELAGMVPYRGSDDVSVMDTDAVTICVAWLDSHNQDAGMELLGLTRS